MGSAGRFGGMSLSLRLLALSVVPLVALVVIGFGDMNQTRTSAEAADGLVASVELRRAISAAYQPAQTERIALGGLARTDELGLPRDLIVEFAGIDLHEIYDANVVTFDERLDGLGEGFESLGAADRAALSGRLDDIRTSIDAIRVETAQGVAQESEVREVFEELDGLLADALVLAFVETPGAQTVFDDQVRLDALAAVELSAGDYAGALNDGLIDPTSDLTVEMVTTWSAHQTRLDALAGLLDDDEVVELEVVRGRLDPIPVELLGGSPVPGSGVAAVDPAYIQRAAAQLVGAVEYLAVLEDYSDGLHRSVLDAATVQAADARAEANRTQLWLLGVVALTLVLIVITAVSILLPIRRLSQRTRAISAGDLAHEPLPVRGPRDVRDLTRAVNEMLGTLHRVEEQITELAAGGPTDGAVDIPGAIGVSIRDSVDHLAEVTAQLHRSERLASAIVTQAADAIWTIDEAGLVTSANEASEQLTHVDAEEQIGRQLTDFLSVLEGETRVRGRHDDTRVLVAHSVIDTAAERTTAVIARDISERSRFEERLAYQARHDALTGLPNRFAVLERLEQLLVDHADSTSALFIDIDGFKSVNDTKGHAAGDRVLREIATRLSSHVRTSEFVARLGGDEFVVLVHGQDSIDNVEAFGERLIREIEQPYLDDDEAFVLSASIGIAYTSPDTSPTETIRQADSAVYVAKRRGRGRVEVFDAELQATIEHDSELELALRRAVHDDELVLHLQPIVDLHTGQMSGAEALVRWDRPGVGLVPPGEFIAIAERSSLIFDLERWVIRAACETTTRWRDRDPDCAFTIAINISGRHLIDADLIGDLDTALTTTGADPSMLVIELTETQLLEDRTRAIDVLNELHRRGIEVAVDDFGTGYSGMTYLRDLPIDAIKIDRTFIAKATDDGYDSTLIEAVLMIGRTLDLKIVAEGVETDEQLAYVRTRGCDQAQGFLLARPLPIDQAEATLFANHATATPAT